MLRCLLAAIALVLHFPHLDRLMPLAARSRALI
jgi:hypothetical protein